MKGKGRADGSRINGKALAAEEAAKRDAELRAMFVVVPPGDEAKSISCPICKESLKSEFLEDDEEWVWRNAVKKEDRVRRPIVVLWIITYTCFTYRYTTLPATLRRCHRNLTWPSVCAASYLAAAVGREHLMFLGHRHGQTGLIMRIRRRVCHGHPLGLRTKWQGRSGRLRTMGPSQRVKTLHRLRRSLHCLRDIGLLGFGRCIFGFYTIHYTLVCCHCTRCALYHYTHASQECQFVSNMNRA